MTKSKRNYRFWKNEEVALIRATILNGGLNKNVEDDLNHLSKILKRGKGSISCKVGREKMTLGLDPQGFTGKTIGYNPHGPIIL